MGEMVTVFLSFLLMALPQIAVAAVGLVLVRTRLRAPHPRAHLHGSIGFSLLLLSALWSVASRTYLQVLLVQGQDRLAVSGKITIANLASFIILSLALVFIAMAVFADRGAARTPHRAT